MKRPKILVVDDDQPILTLMQKLLAEYKFDTIVAASGTVAIDLARSKYPNLILLDLKMPDMSGAEVIQTIRSEPGLKQVPILILSGEPVSKRQIESVGADGAVQKPFDIDDLIQQIQSRLQPVA